MANIKFINLKVGEQLATLTTVRPDEVGEHYIQTRFVTPLTPTVDPGVLGLKFGRSRKGSIRPVITDDGSIALMIHPFRTTESDNQNEPEDLCTTPHGRLYQNNRMTRIVFEFPLKKYSFAAVSDAIDDEMEEIRHYLDNPAD